MASPIRSSRSVSQVGAPGHADREAGGLVDDHSPGAVARRRSPGARPARPRRPGTGSCDSRTRPGRSDRPRTGASPSRHHSFSSAVIPATMSRAGVPESFTVAPDRSLSIRPFSQCGGTAVNRRRRRRLLVEVDGAGAAVLVGQRLDQAADRGVLAGLPCLGDGLVVELAVPGEVPPPGDVAVAVALVGQDDVEAGGLPGRLVRDSGVRTRSAPLAPVPGSAPSRGRSRGRGHGRHGRGWS